MVTALLAQHEKHLVHMDGARSSYSEPLRGPKLYEERSSSPGGVNTDHIGTVTTDD